MSKRNPYIPSEQAAAAAEKTRLVQRESQKHYAEERAELKRQAKKPSEEVLFGEHGETEEEQIRQDAQEQREDPRTPGE